VLDRIIGLESKLDKLSTVDAKLDLVMKHLNIYEPVQTQVIDDRF